MSKPESGEMEWWKGFEELITRNLNTIKDFTQTTRQQTVELKKEVEELKNMLNVRDQKLTLLQQQISNLQAKLYLKGSQ